MQKITLKNIKYDELEAIQNYLMIGVVAGKPDIDDAAWCTVMSVIAELYIKLLKKTMFVDKTKKYSLKLTAQQSFAFLAYTQHYESGNMHTQTVIMAIRNEIHKQLI